MVIWNFLDNSAKLGSQLSKQWMTHGIERLINNPTAMASSSSSSSGKIFLQGSDDITLEVDEAVAKQSVTIKHMIEDSLASRGPILLPKVPGNILVKVPEYYKHVVTQPPADENDVDLKTFVSALVNNHRETIFGLLVAVNYLDIKGLFFPCK
ncbi:hypothetical protein M9H77_16947 [Catharanthus roseus]|uniref:Uncharacterized protein n=1 Tax=Catharanthus roseus TaxID=4058 RepID=A0ACC0B376_CATRO|nr:hypothetical protein M9H77_16947 [Catharanthus roseus]